MTPAQQRLQLLAKIQREGEQPVERSFALSELFPDMSISSWCIQHGLQFRVETFSRVAGRDDKWIFLCFSKLDDSAL